MNKDELELIELESELWIRELDAAFNEGWEGVPEPETVFLGEPDGS